MLNGSNYFLFNQGGGIMLVNARLQVKGRLLIALNAAIFGGGIAMEDSCLVSESFMNGFFFFNSMDYYSS